MQVLAIDSGRNGLKAVCDTKRLLVPSVVGEWRQLNLSDGGDYEVEINNEKYFVGDRAANESRFRRENVSRSKIHEETKILTLTAAGLLAPSPKIKIVTGLPVEQYRPDIKQKYKDLLLGSYNVKVNNGPNKIIKIEDVVVSIEGAGAYWWYVFKYNNEITKSRVRVIDIGSRTINCLTIDKMRYVDLDSFSLNYGTIEITNADEEDTSLLMQQFTRRATSDISRRWLGIEKDIIIITGGGAISLDKYLKQFYQSAITIEDSVFASALGFYEMGVRM